MPNGHDPTRLQLLQRAYTHAYKETLEKYRNARILWAIITREGYIIVANSYWSELGYKPEQLHFTSLYNHFAIDSGIVDMVSKVHIQSTQEEVLVIHRANGEPQSILCWLSSFVEKSSGAWVANFSAVLIDD